MDNVVFLKDGDSVVARVPVRFQSGTLQQSSGDGEVIGRGVGSLWIPCDVKVVNGKIIAEMDVSKFPGEQETLLRRFIAGFNGGK